MLFFLPDTSTPYLVLYWYSMGIYIFGLFLLYNRSTSFLLEITDADVDGSTPSSSNSILTPLTSCMSSFLKSWFDKLRAFRRRLQDGKPDSIKLDLMEGGILPPENRLDENQPVAPVETDAIGAQPTHGEGTTLQANGSQLFFALGVNKTAMDDGQFDVHLPASAHPLFKVDSAKVNSVPAQLEAEQPALVGDGGEVQTGSTTDGEEMEDTNVSVVMKPWEDKKQHGTSTRALRQRKVLLSLFFF